jgi:hypothetical protein
MSMMSKLFTGLVCLTLLFAISAAGQTNQNLNSASYAVSVDRVQGLYAPDTVLAGKDLRWTIRLKNDSFNFAISNGFKVYSPDGALWDSTRGDTLGWRPGDPTPGIAILGRASFDIQYNINKFSADGAGSDTIGFIAAKIATAGLAPGFNDTAWAVTAYKVSTASHGKHICIDSSFFRPGGVWKWAASAGVNRFPTWDGPHCYVVIDTGYHPPAGIVLSKDTLKFAGIEGASNPSNQSFDITSSGSQFNFTLYEGSSWLSKSPIQGTSPRTIIVSVNTVGLTSGVYFDSIRVDAPTALNTPRFVYIRLTITPPPPVIVASPTSMSFNALVGGSNPASSVLHISNGDGGTLHWSVAKSQTWLSLTPASGVNTGSVTVSVDITGLAIGEYTDDIVISDPAATNNPVTVPVKLTVASSLPVIAADSAYNYIIAVSNNPTPPPRDVRIYNVGGGTFSFKLTKTSNRLFTVIPDTGAAPMTVQVGFKLPGEIGDSEDTLWVNSTEASNSPYPVIFHFHLVDAPAIMNINRDTVKLEVAECSQFYSPILPADTFVVSNLGGDNPMLVKAVYESPYFALDTNQAFATHVFTVTALTPSVPAGTYYDSIWVQSVKAINSPHLVIVQYSLVPGSHAPFMQLSKTSIIVPRQEDAGPAAIYSQVRNRWPGCMPWRYTEDISWYRPLASSGEVGELVAGLVDPVGLTMGTYKDSFYVEAPSATNSPVKLNLELRVWRFHGDLDWDGVIDIVDLTWMIDFLFVNGAIQRPEYVVGDLNCDGKIDIADLTYFVDYLWDFGPIPCGNPY